MDDLKLVNLKPLVWLLLDIHTVSEYLIYDFYETFPETLCDVEIKISSLCNRSRHLSDDNEM